jgi:hypothetical protein
MLEKPSTLLIIVGVTVFVEYPEGAAHAGPAVGGITHAVDVGTAPDSPWLDLSANATIPVFYSGNQTPPRDESTLTLVGFAIDVREGSAYSV